MWPKKVSNSKMFDLQKGLVRMCRAEYHTSDIYYILKTLHFISIVHYMGIYWPMYLRVPGKQTLGIAWLCKTSSRHQIRFSVSLEKLSYIFFFPWVGFIVQAASLPKICKLELQDVSASMAYLLLQCKRQIFFPRRNPPNIPERLH